MPRSDNSFVDRIGLEPLRSLSRYDLVLAVIPVAFLLSIVFGHLLSVPFRTTMFSASGIGALALLDALFVNPPIRPTQ